MTHLIATKEVWYNGRKHNPGEMFEVDRDVDVTILTAHDVHGGPRARRAQEGETQTASTVPAARVEPPVPPALEVVETPPELPPEPNWGDIQEVAQNKDDNDDNVNTLVENVELNSRGQRRFRPKKEPR